VTRKESLSGEEKGKKTGFQEVTEEVIQIGGRGSEKFVKSERQCKRKEEGRGTKTKKNKIRVGQEVWESGEHSSKCESYRKRGGWSGKKVSRDCKQREK